MPTIDGRDTDGFVQSYLQGTWADLRIQTGAQYSVDTDNERDSAPIYVYYSSGMRGTVFGLIRAFFDFDVSGITIEPASATLNIRGYTRAEGDLIAVKSVQGASLSTSDWHTIQGAGEEFAASNGSGAGTLDGATGVTVYSEKFTSWSTSGYNQVDITAAGLTAMKDMDDFQFCLMEYDHDFLDVAPTTIVRNGLYWGDSGTYPPYIDYVAGGVAVTHNATFFGTNF